MLSHISALVQARLRGGAPWCADAGTSFQQRGQSLPGNAEALRDLADRYAVGRYSRRPRRVRRVCMLLHGSCLSVVVQIIDEFDVLPTNLKITRQFR